MSTSFNSTVRAEIRSRTTFEFNIEVRRQITFYVWKVFVPLSLIVFTSWLVFWIDPSQLGVQSGIGTAMLLTVVAFLFSLQNILPQIPYLTRLDVFVYSALVLVFLALRHGGGAGGAAYDARTGTYAPTRQGSNGARGGGRRGQ